MTARETTGLDLVPFRLLVDRALEPTRTHIGRLYLGVALPLAAAGLVLALVQVRWNKTLLAGDAMPEEVFGMFGGILGVSFAWTALWGVTVAAATVAATRVLDGEEPSMARAWGFVLRPRVFATLAVVGLLAAGSAVFCLVPALYVVPVFAFAIPAMAAEDVSGMTALRRAVELAHFRRGRGWTRAPWVQSLALLTVVWTITTALNLTLQLPTGVLQFYLTVREAAGGEVANLGAAAGSHGWIAVPVVVLAALLDAAAWLYGAFGMAMLFREVRRRKEAPDLERAVDDLVRS